MNQNYHTSFEDLLVKYLLHEADPEEMRAIEEWLAAGPANRRYYEQVRLIWEKSLHLSPGHGFPGIPGEEETAWQKFREKLHVPRRHHAPIRPFRWAAIAAIFLLAALTPFLWRQHTGSTARQTLAAQNAIKTDTLPDGSIVTLNKNSSLSLPEKFKERDVELRGEAFFRVAVDRDHPFHVHASGIDIIVLGTSFNVRSHTDKTVILVESGRIGVSNRYGHLELNAGETITLGDSDRALTKTKPAAADMLYRYYHPRDFVCNGTPLWQLVNALNKAYGDSVAIGNPALRDLPITTTFHNEDLNHVLDIITKTLDIHVQRTDTRYILK
ncbi:MAG TPA: FecR domain-containing protein [Puia sp.]|nr:FecR domain-containing protein [Puia sp.]